MILRNKMVYFNSDNAYYRKEKSGSKNNTVQIVTENEYDVIQYSDVRRIAITDSDNLDSFERKITDISRIGTICGNVVVVFTWEI
jgi:hypothetical protein